MLTRLLLLSVICHHHTTVSAKNYVLGLSVRCICLSVNSSGLILLPQYLMNGLNNFDETYREYSLDTTDDLIGFWRSNDKVTAGRQRGKGILLKAGVLKSILL